MSSNLDFYRRRESDERATAAQTQDPRIRGIHLEMAVLYAKLAAIDVEGPLLKQVG